MNREFVYKDGQAIIIDDKGEQRTEEYYDGLEDVLVQEDLIEQMEANLASLEAESDEDDYNKTVKSWKRMIVVPLLIGVGVPLLMAGVEVLSRPELELVNSFLGMIHPGVLVCLIMIVPCSLFSGYFSWMAAKKLKNEVKMQRSREVQIDFLRRSIGKAKENIAELKKDKKNTKKEDFEVAVVHSEASIETMEAYQDLYADIGYNEEELLKGYETGSLESELQMVYDDTAIGVVKSYFDENALSLSRKRRNSKS